MKKQAATIIIILLTGGASAQLTITEDGLNFSRVDNPVIGGYDFPDQDLSVKNNSNGFNDKIQLSDGGEILIKDDVGTKIQKWSLSGNYLLNNSGFLEVDEYKLNQTIDARDDYEKDTNISDTNASTECGSGQVLTGNGCESRYSSSDDGDTSNTNEIQGVDDVLGQDNTATNQLDMSSGTLVVPTGDVY